MTLNITKMRYHHKTIDCELQYLLQRFPPFCRKIEPASRLLALYGTTRKVPIVVTAGESFWKGGRQYRTLLPSSPALTWPQTSKNELRPAGDTQRVGVNLLSTYAIFNWHWEYISGSIRTNVILMWCVFYICAYMYVSKTCNTYVQLCAASTARVLLVRSRQ